MRLIFSDTGPINYLVLIGHIDILPALCARIIMPFAVPEELSRQKTPSAVREWIARPRAWLSVQGPPAHYIEDAFLSSLGEGEIEAIKLAASLPAETLLLMDDRAAVLAARRSGLTVTGTIGILEEAARHGLLDLDDEFARLRRTTFRYPEELVQQLLAQETILRVCRRSPGTEDKFVHCRGRRIAASPECPGGEFHCMK